MPLPLVPVVIAIVASVATGGGIAVRGGTQMRKAKLIQRDAAASHEDALTAFRVVETRVQECAHAYGEHQLKVQSNTLGAWLRWLEENAKKVRQIERAMVDGVEVEMPDIPTLKARVVESVHLLTGGAGAAVAAYGAYNTALWGVGAFATAGTGTAISGLTGVAATNATLAWLGGGTLAAGGGGMALGAVMLTGIAIAPAALAGGFAVGVQGQRALTRAFEIRAGVEVAIAEMHEKEALLERVEVRIAELKDALDGVVRRAGESLQALSSRSFDPDQDLRLFQETALLMRAVGEILSTPVVDIEGRPSEQSLRVKEKYAA